MESNLYQWVRPCANIAWLSWFTPVTAVTKSVIQTTRLLSFNKLFAEVLWLQKLSRNGGCTCCSGTVTAQIVQVLWLCKLFMYYDSLTSCSTSKNRDCACKLFRYCDCLVNCPGIVTAVVRFSDIVTALVTSGRQADFVFFSCWPAGGNLIAPWPIPASVGK